jgi:N-acetylmuramoyl-L-alanine amidase
MDPMDLRFTGEEASSLVGCFPSRIVLRSCRPRLSIGLLLFCIVLVAAGSGEEKRISIYSPVADYSLNVNDREGREYVGLLETLEPLGSISAKTDHDNWKLRFNSIEAQFTNGNAHGRVRNKDVDLGARFLLDKGRGLVPVDSLVTLLPQFLGIPVVLHVNSRRLFISETGIIYTAEMNKGSPGKLTLNFSRPVNPSISTEPGKLKMSFVRDPLLASGPQTVTYNDKSIASATFQEGNGAADITIAGNVSLLASFSNDGRTITIAPAPGPVAANVPVGPAPALPSNISSAPTSPALTPTAPPPTSRFIVMIDASHGGDERGAALSDKLAEKDVTLAFARKIRQELETRGIPALVLRDGDATLGLDQRTASVNAQHPVLYIGVHAANDSSGVRVYTAIIPPDLSPRGPFVAWDAAQNSSLGISQLSAAVISTELSKKIPTRTLAAPVPPLKNITVPAITIEVAPQAGDIADLTSSDYQTSVATAVAAGVETMKPRLEGRR